MSPASSFWAFSLTIYAEPGVEAACLELQDRFGADVNLALYCLWIGRALTTDSMDAAIATAEPMQAYIRPLREMRRVLPKDADGGLRETVKKAELAAEKLEQDALEALAGPGRPDAVLARHNLALYAGRLGADADALVTSAHPLLAAIPA